MKRNALLTDNDFYISVACSLTDTEIVFVSQVFREFL